MHALKIFVRILKFLAKAVLGLLVIILVAVAIIHIPMVQKSIAGKLSSFLSSKLESRVTIESVKFSLFGDVRIENVTLWDPQQNQILSAQTIEATSDIFD